MLFSSLQTSLLYCGHTELRTQFKAWVEPFEYAAVQRHGTLKPNTYHFYMLFIFYL